MPAREDLLDALAELLCTQLGSLCVDEDESTATCERVADALLQRGWTRPLLESCGHVMGHITGRGVIVCEITARPPNLVTAAPAPDPVETRRRALQLLDEGVPPDQVCARLGVSRGLLRRWDDGPAS